MGAAAARRYARAVFELASEEGEIEAWGERLARMRGLLGRPQVRAVAANPSIPGGRRQQAVAGLLEGAGREAQNLAKLLVGAGRLEDMDGIVQEYGRLADAAAGRIQATAITAVALAADEVASLARDLTAGLGSELRLATRVDPSIIGGLVVEVGDRVIDASVASRLRRLRASLAGPQRPAGQPGPS